MSVEKKPPEVNFHSLEFQYWGHKEGRKLFLNWVKRIIKKMEIQVPAKKGRRDEPSRKIK